MTTPPFRQFSEGSNAKGARSTALHALQWGMGLLLASLPATIYAGSPEWLLIFLTSCLGILFITFIGAYIYLLGKDRDALRSENFSLSKMAIEKGLVGDDITGLIKDGENLTNLIGTEIVNDEGSKQ